jgi:hypothetical protein
MQSAQVNKKLIFHNKFNSEYYQESLASSCYQKDLQS